jgi:hypothetical protein
MASDWIDTVVIIELKQVYADHCLPNNIDNSNDEIDPDWDFLASVETVLKYYMTDSEYNEWIKEHASKNWSL